MRWPSTFRVAVVLLVLCHDGGRHYPSRRPSVGRADASSAADRFQYGVRGGHGGRGGGGNGSDDGKTRWKHKGSGVSVGGGGGGDRRSSHHRQAVGRPYADLNVGMLVPKTSFIVRGYVRAINDAMHSINKAYKKNRTMDFNHLYKFEAQNVRYLMMSLTPSPTGRYRAKHELQ